MDLLCSKAIFRKPKFPSSNQTSTFFCQKCYPQKRGTPPPFPSLSFLIPKPASLSTLFQLPFPPYSHKRAVAAKKKKRSIKEAVKHIDSATGFSLFFSRREWGGKGGGGGGGLYERKGRKICRKGSLLRRKRRGRRRRRFIFFLCVQKLGKQRPGGEGRGSTRKMMKKAKDRKREMHKQNDKGT